MGIGGHMLGEVKLRRLQRVTGLQIDRAYRRNQACEGRVVKDGQCTHYDIDWNTGEYEAESDPVHWSSCPK